MKKYMHRTRVAAAALALLLTAALVLGFSTGSALAAVPRAFGHGLSVPAQSGSASTLSGVLIFVGYLAAVGVIATIGWSLDRRHLRQESQATSGPTKHAPTYADSMRRPHTWHGHAA